MANTPSKSIGILFSVAGGDSLAAGSGKIIQDQLNQIAKNINDDGGIKILVTPDMSKVKDMIDKAVKAAGETAGKGGKRASKKITEALDETNKEAGKKAAETGAQIGSNLGGAIEKGVGDSGKLAGKKIVDSLGETKKEISKEVGNIERQINDDLDSAFNKKDNIAPKKEESVGILSDKGTTANIREVASAANSLAQDAKTADSAVDSAGKEVKELGEEAERTRQQIEDMWAEYESHDPEYEKTKGLQPTRQENLNSKPTESELTGYWEEADKYYDKVEKASDRAEKAETTRLEKLARSHKQTYKTLQSDLRAYNDMRKKLESGGFGEKDSEAYSAAKAEIDKMETLANSAKNVLENKQGFKFLDDGEIENAREFHDAVSSVKTNFTDLGVEVAGANAKLRETKKETKETVNATIMLNKAWASKDKFKNLEDYPELLQKYNDLISELQDKVKNKVKLDSQDVTEIKGRINDFENEAYDLGVQVDTLGEAIEKKIGDRLKYLIGQFAIDFVVQGLRRIYDNVLQIDAAMTELKKVTDETDEVYDRFLTNASQRAKELGASLVEVIQMTSDYARLGYNVDEASKLADAAIIYKNVGDGLKDTDEATDHLISTMNAFGIAAEDSMRIVDAFNEVSNNFAVTSSDIGAGLQRSSAAMAAAGNSMEETIALFTAGNTIIRDADTMGTSLKTMSMRLRSTKSDLEAMGKFCSAA